MVRILTDLSQLAEAASGERGWIGATIGKRSGGQPTPDAATLEQMTKTRAAFDQARKVMMDALATAGFDGHEEIAANLTRTLARFDQLHAEAEAERALPDRDASVLETWVREMVAAGDGFTQEVNRLSAALDQTDAEAAHFADLGVLGANMREWAGRKSAIMLAMLRTGTGPSATVLLELGASQGHIDHLWEQLSLAAAAQGAPPELSTARQTVESGYAVPMRALMERLGPAIAGVAPSPIDAAEWRRLTQPLYKSITTLRDVPLAQAARLAAAHKRQAIRDLEVGAGLLAMTLLSVVVCAVALGRRISAPVVGLTGVVVALAAGKRDNAIPGGRRRDELGAMARAVAVLQDNAEAAARATAAREREQQAKLDRKLEVDRLISAFDGESQRIGTAVATAAVDMARDAGTLTDAADATRGQAAAVAAAVAEMSANIQTVAAAAEE